MGSCEHGDEPLCAIKFGEFLDWLRNLLVFFFSRRTVLPTATLCIYVFINILTVCSPRRSKLPEFLAILAPCVFRFPHGVVKLWRVTWRHSKEEYACQCIWIRSTPTILNGACLRDRVSSFFSVSAQNYSLANVPYINTTETQPCQPMGAVWPFGTLYLYNSELLVMRWVYVGHTTHSPQRLCISLEHK